MLIFPLKKQWYDKIKSGEKTVEYREFKRYWTKRIYVEFKKQFAKRYEFFSAFPNYDSFTKDLEEMPVIFGDGTERSPVLWDCKLRLGYTKEYLSAKISKIEVVDGKDTDLHIDKLVYAIHIVDVKEENE